MAERWFKHLVDARASQHLRQLAARMGWPRQKAYACWFMLLEEAYKTDDGMLDPRPVMGVLAEDMGVCEEELADMLQACAEVGMIDRRCWAEHGVVTSEAIGEQVSAREAKKRPRKPKGTRTCPSCGREFRPSNNRATYCSQACRQAAYESRKKVGS